MFKDLIKQININVAFNITDADNGDIRESGFSAGVVCGFAEVIRGMGHKVEFESRDDDDCAEDGGCERIWRIEIDGIALVRDGEIDRDGYEKLLKK